MKIEEKEERDDAKVNPKILPGVLLCVINVCARAVGRMVCVPHKKIEPELNLTQQASGRGKKEMNY